MMNQDWIIFCGPDSSWKYLQQNLWRQSFEDVSHSALKKFADFLGKHLCRSLPCNFMKERLRPWYYPVDFAKLLKIPIL